MDPQLSGPNQAQERAEKTRPEAADKLHELLATLWNRSRSTIGERLDSLRDAQTRLCADMQDQDSRRNGGDAAHKLAGILGTFGLPQGTELARNAEVILESEGMLTGEHLLQLKQWIDELESMIERKTRETAPRNGKV